MPASTIRLRSHAISLASVSLLATSVCLSGTASAQSAPYFAAGNVVVMVEGCGVHAGTCTNVASGTGNGTGNSSTGGYGDQQAAPITLFQYAPNGTASVTFVNALQLPVNGSGANLPMSGEYGSNSEGMMQLSGNGQYLALLGYGINPEVFDQAYYPGFTANPYGAAPSGNLAQSGSLTGQSYTPVPRVVALIDANGNVNTATGVENVFNTNNPRSVYTLTGATAYISGQGSGTDATGGVFYVPLGAATSAPVAITGLDTVGNSAESQDTRFVQIYNQELLVSVDSSTGSNNRDYIGNLGLPAATGLYNGGAGPTQLNGFGTGSSGKVTITSGSNSNGNGFNTGLQVNLSPESYFFASPSVLYVADSGQPHNSSASSSLGDGGLQKWVNSSASGSGTWTLAYTLYAGLSLVENTGKDGITGLYGVAGAVNGTTVQLYVTSENLGDLDRTFLYGITDTLAYTQASQAAGEVFTLLDEAPADSNFRSVAFVPTIPAGSVEVVSSPSGFAFTASGTGCAAGAYTTPVTLAWTPGSACTLQAASPQTDLGTAYTFVNWQGSSTSPALAVTAPSTTATYKANFALNTSANLAASLNPVSIGQPVTLTSTVTGGGATPTGTVSFTLYGSSLISEPVNAGVATLAVSTNGLPPGTYPLIAEYSGDATHAASQSAALNVTLAVAPTATSLAIAPTSLTPPTDVTFTATVARSANGSTGTPTGTVTFYYESVALATAAVNGSGVASLTAPTSGIPAASYPITAKYNGDGSDAASTSAPVTVTVQ